MTATLFVPPYEWGAQYSSAEEYVQEGKKYDECGEGFEFELVRLEVGAKTRYRVVNGLPTPIEVSFPDPL